CLATSEGSRKIALPITWLTPIAVRSHLPSARLSPGSPRRGLCVGGWLGAGASGDPAISLFPSRDELLDARRQRVGGERLHEQVGGAGRIEPAAGPLR